MATKQTHMAVFEKAAKIAETSQPANQRMHYKGVIQLEQAEQFLTLFSEKYGDAFVANPQAVVDAPRTKSGKSSMVFQLRSAPGTPSATVTYWRNSRRLHGDGIDLSDIVSQLDPVPLA